LLEAAEAVTMVIRNKELAELVAEEVLDFLMQQHK
jgi:hypothetical protein